MIDDPRFDREILAHLVRTIGSGVVGEIIDLFLEDVPERMGRFEESRRSGDLAASAEVLHSIKGSAALLGTVRLRDVAGEMEALASNGETEGFTARVAELETAFADAVAFLRERRAGLDG